MSGQREILIECVKINTTLRVTAIDVETGREIVFQAPARTGQETIKRIAVDKMNFVLSKDTTNKK